MSSNQVGILAGGNHGIVTDNSILAGVDLGGDNNVASNNEITESGQAAILIEGIDNTVLGNQSTEAPAGILTLADAIGNIRSGNSYFAILTKIENHPCTKWPTPAQKARRPQPPVARRMVAKRTYSLKLYEILPMQESRC